MRSRLLGIDVNSAGVAALAGKAADPLTGEVARENGVSLEGHIARKFTPELGNRADLILVMEPGHRQEILRIAPHLAGRIMLFDNWSGAVGIEDPYRKPRSTHETVVKRLAEATDAWAKRLLPKDTL